MQNRLIYNSFFCLHRNGAADKTVLEMLAEVPQMPKRFFSLAELPQMPKRSFFDLRNFRKCQNVLFSLAELPQMPKRSFFDLRNFRKHFQNGFECRGASISPAFGLVRPSNSRPFNACSDGCVRDKALPLYKVYKPPCIRCTRQDAFSRLRLFMTLTTPRHQRAYLEQMTDSSTALPTFGLSNETL